MQISPRDRRLSADARAISQLVHDSSILTADGRGNPPTQYRFRFSGKGLACDASGNVVLQTQHEVHVELGAAYPRLMPAIYWKTPIFHPNISTNGVVCLGGYGTNWVPSLTLAELCNMIWDMIRMKNFDINSPYNRDAALWIREQEFLKFPVDPRPLRDRVVEEAFANNLAEAGSKNGNGDDGIEIIDSNIEVVRAGDSAIPRPDVIFIE